MRIEDSAAPAYQTRPRRGFRLRRSDRVIAALLVLGLVLLVLVPLSFFAILPGQVGVLYKLFFGGTVTTSVHHEGIGIKWPWNRIYRYDVRTQTSDETVHGLANNGLRVAVEMTVLYHPVPDKAGELHQTVGPDYLSRLVRPTTIEAVRNVIGQYDPHDIYQLDISALEQEILGQLKKAPVGLVHYRGVFVRNIVLPEAVNEAINRKLTEEQYAFAYDYLIEQAEKEAERKRIEAIGIQTFYSIVADALSPQLLTWRGIEATVDIARSNNAKVVIVGGGKDQLPLILGSDIAQQPQLPNPEAVDAAANQLPDLKQLPPLFPDLSVRPQDRLRPQMPVPGGARMGIEPDASQSTPGDATSREGVRMGVEPNASSAGTASGESSETPNTGSTQ